MRALVTGGAGFIGSHLAQALLERGIEVDIVDDLSTGRLSNIPAGAKFYRMDIRDPHLQEVIAGGKFDVVFHLAAQMDVRKSVADPTFDAEVNILGGINLLQACRHYHLPKVIFASTGGAIYGEQSTFPATEDHPQNPYSPYGISKLAFEKYLYFYHLEYGLRYVALRYANVYGPRQRGDGEAGVVAIFMEKMLSGQKAVIYGDGNQTRDFTYVADVVAANLAALNFEACGVFNVGTGVETSINHLFDMIKALTGSNQERIHQPPRPGEQKRSVIDYTAINRAMGWRPQYSLERGLAETAAFFAAERKHG